MGGPGWPKARAERGPVSCEVLPPSCCLAPEEAGLGEWGSSPAILKPRYEGHWSQGKRGTEDTGQPLKPGAGPQPSWNLPSCAVKWEELIPSFCL